MRVKRFLHFFRFPVTLTVDHFRNEFAELVTIAQCCISSKLEVSTAFLLREIRRHGAHERRRATLNAGP